LDRITLYIKNGVYNEKIELPSSNTDVTFIGENVDSTIITFNDHTGRGKINTFTSFTAKICGNRFVAENISFVNAAGPVGQGVALHVEADQAVFRNCKFLGNQDTIYASGENSRQLFECCFIEGTTDFIFGPATAVFTKCTIRCKSNSYITASNTPFWKKFGFVFLDCHVLADTNVKKLYLGRPWRAYSNTVFIRTALPAVIHPEGWENWSNPENEKTAYYGEYKNYGPGATTQGRPSWIHQFSEKEAQQYTIDQIFLIQSSSKDEVNGWFKQPTQPFIWNQKNNDKK
jgi:pectinesterase